MVLIEIESGKLLGKISLDRDGRQFYSFQNLPYGEPPIGSLRFRAPRPARPWSGIRDATKEGNESVQRHAATKKIIGSEDCLNLNVYSPKLFDEYKNLKPVMFWIHGGVLMMGSNKTELFGPEFLVAEDIVLVTINYRLGILGFLSLEDANLGVPGNAGFKDMVLALKWVQKNIHYFGGDPNNVTVFGESSGAAAAHLLMLSKMTKGLMHKVIAQSASALQVWMEGKRSAPLIGKVLGFSNFDEAKLLEFLQKLPVEDFVKAQVIIDTMDYFEKNIRFFGYVVERFSDEEPFLTRHPLDIIQSGDYNQIPIILGYNHREGMAFERLIPYRVRDLYFSDMELSVPLCLKIERGCDLSKTITQKLEGFYFGHEQPDRNNEKHVTQYYDLCTDTCFFRDVYLAAYHQRKTSKAAIYFYKLSVVSNLNIYKKRTNMAVSGVYHGDDIGYLFKTIFTPKIQPRSLEDKSSRRITRMWTNFAKYGDPTPKLGTLLKIKWKPVTTQAINYIDINTELEMKVEPEKERMKFWRSIFALNPVFSKL